MQWGERVLNSNIVEDKGVSVAVRKTGLNAARSVYIKNLGRCDCVVLCCVCVCVCV